MARVSAGPYRRSATSAASRSCAFFCTSLICLSVASDIVSTHPANAVWFTSVATLSTKPVHITPNTFIAYCMP